MLLSKIKIEFLANFLITFFLSCSSINTFAGVDSPIAYSVCAFFIITIITWVAKPISSSLFNPTITASMILTNHIDITKGIYMMIFQFFGVAFGACISQAVMPMEIMNIMQENHTLYGIVLGVKPFQAFLYEMVAGFFIVFVFYGVVLEKNQLPFVDGVGMGAVYFFLSIFLFKKTGALFDCFKGLIFYLTQMNVSFPWYYFGSLVGGILGGFLGAEMLSETPSERKKRMRKEKQRRLNKEKMIEDAQNA